MKTKPAPAPWSYTCAVWEETPHTPTGRSARIVSDHSSAIDLVSIDSPGGHVADVKGRGPRFMVSDAARIVACVNGWAAMERAALVLGASLDRMADAGMGFGTAGTDNAAKAYREAIAAINRASEVTE